MRVSSLIDFLNARIDEDEARALSKPAAVDDSSVTAVQLGSARYLTTRPTRLLAECTAKRVIVELHRLAGRSEPDIEVAFLGACLALATVYMDHPEFSPEWLA